MMWCPGPFANGPDLHESDLLRRQEGVMSLGLTAGWLPLSRLEDHQLSTEAMSIRRIRARSEKH
jgi:hypothetical protein